VTSTHGDGDNPEPRFSDPDLIQPPAGPPPRTPLTRATRLRLYLALAAAAIAAAALIWALHRVRRRARSTGSRSACSLTHPGYCDRRLDGISVGVDSLDAMSAETTTEGEQDPGLQARDQIKDLEARISRVKSDLRWFRDCAVTLMVGAATVALTLLLGNLPVRVARAHAEHPDRRRRDRVHR
jgi:hypothetical protein